MATKKKSGLVFFDTSALIPLLEKTQPLHARLVQYFTGKNPSRAIDTIVLSEYLAGILEKDAESSSKFCENNFQVHPFSILSARICAELFRFLQAHGQVPKSSGKRQITKVDAMVLSSAIASHADEFLFGDGCFSAWAPILPTQFCGITIPAFVQITQLPPAPLQGDLGLSPSSP